MWQVSGRSDITDFEEVVRLDTEYISKDYEITYVESYKDGSKFDKLLKGICGYFHFAYVLMFHKPDVVHIHSSFGPSFYRKMPFIYMASWRKIPIVNHIHGADFDEFYVNAPEEKKAKIKKVYSKQMYSFYHLITRECQCRCWTQWGMVFQL